MVHPLRLRRRDGALRRAERDAARGERADRAAVPQPRAAVLLHRARRGGNRGAPEVGRRRAHSGCRRTPQHVLAHTERSITEIAYTIGFSDPSNFSRTCARWFGCSPAAYRRRIRQLPT
ncbi:helix-turn-helix domain-containing protein [uncultured Sutterella sp.]|uniref:helix-turn-helix domain-containing protein n=1 Tax=uncultured Sutterella sp. TaxID=286133 RepID=UPI0025DE646D|nr:helix-turn-helix domain-containing protein [uncultured Sutterella sp.]